MAEKEELCHRCTSSGHDASVAVLYVWTRQMASLCNICRQVLRLGALLQPGSCTTGCLGGQEAKKLIFLSIGHLRFFWRRQELQLSSHVRCTVQHGRLSLSQQCAAVFLLPNCVDALASLRCSIAAQGWPGSCAGAFNLV